MKVLDKNFKVFISQEQIAQRVKELGEMISKDYQDKNPLFISVLNGSFVFTADLMRELDILPQVSFIKVSSYEKMSSTGSVKEHIGLNENVFNRHLILVEDIVDTGNTIVKLYEMFKELGPASIEVASALLKPEAYKKEINVKYVGFEIPNKFVLGYGLDYDGYGRNLKDIYQLAE
ncbi:hypoxanthine phosphoribosyltransferase [Aureibacter tunicatorum]|uniref:Hypoxanthine phosphoribosyltransferase n=1 Tax=Aureibacter tunicatorum TaxID=866807 RepID=A0AAE3XNJ4_9BACT|nr:hypoxanthine phosphoribosyltransferase [Aureibacter tunicatorum]MDR6240227.1 hypoxanthine phosphoribosyltransferase [Aureibacter tunicatorum]BDD05892.1 hypoxanthine phosphoribosyltransferase [Aureibacter tunicatorum]